LKLTKKQINEAPDLIRTAIKEEANKEVERVKSELLESLKTGSIVDDVMSRLKDSIKENVPDFIVASAESEVKWMSLLTEKKMAAMKKQAKKNAKKAQKELMKSLKGKK